MIIPDRYFPFLTGLFIGSTMRHYIDEEIYNQRERNSICSSCNKQKQAPKDPPPESSKHPIQRQLQETIPDASSTHETGNSSSASPPPLFLTPPSQDQGSHSHSATFNEAQVVSADDVDADTDIKDNDDTKTNPSTISLPKGSPVINFTTVATNGSGIPSHAMYSLRTQAKAREGDETKSNSHQQLFGPITQKEAKAQDESKVGVLPPSKNSFFPSWFRW